MLDSPTPSRLFTAPLAVVNIGLPQFAEDLASAGVAVTCMPARRSTWERMCGPMRGAICRRGRVRGLGRRSCRRRATCCERRRDFHPNHHFDAVGPMTGMTTPRCR
jgi:hypothetical protein